MAEARDFHCLSHIFENLVKRSIPSDHAAVRVVIQKPTIRGHQGKRIPSWMSKHPVFCCLFKRLDDEHQYPADPFGALADFKTILEKAKTQTVRELSRKTHGSLGVKLLTASTVLRAYRNRHLGALMHCCEAWEPVGKCFDQCSFECIDFHGLSQIIASLTRERIAEREAEYVTSLALAKCRFDLRAWRSKKPMLCLHSITDEDGHPLLPVKTATLWKMKTNRAGYYVNIGVRYLRRVLKASGTVATRLSCDTFRKLLTTYVGKLTEMNLMNSWPQKKRIRGSQFLYNAYKHVLAGGPIPAQFASSRTVFIPKSSDVDNNCFIVRSPDAPRPLTQCNCDCKILTTAICRGLQRYTMRCMDPSQRCISARHMTDNIFEVETTALAHVACAPRESGILLTDVAAAYPSVNHSWMFHVLKKAELPEFICRFLRMIYYNTWSLQE